MQIWNLGSNMKKGAVSCFTGARYKTRIKLVLFFERKVVFSILKLDGERSESTSELITKQSIRTSSLLWNYISTTKKVLCLSYVPFRCSIILSDSCFQSSANTVHDKITWWYYTSQVTVWNFGDDILLRLSQRRK